MTHIATRQTALEAFIAAKAEIDARLARLQAHSDEHFGYGPDEINWGHVGAVADCASLLRRISDAVFQEGECAG
jgi:hypothetical protein